MTRPVAALTSELLVRKGMAQPLGLRPNEPTPVEVAESVRPSLALVHDHEPSETPVLLPPRTRNPLDRLSRTWSALAMRWGLPTILFVAGFGIIAGVAVSGPVDGPAVVTKQIIVPVQRPQGPTPVHWVDNGLMANPALAGR